MHSDSVHNIFNRSQTHTMDVPMNRSYSLVQQSIVGIAGEGSFVEKKVCGEEGVLELFVTTQWYLRVMREWWFLTTNLL